MGLVRDFVERLARVFEELGRRPEREYTDPLALFIVSLVLTYVSGTWGHPWALAASLIYSLVLLALYRPPLRPLLEVYTLLAVLAVVPAAPLLFLEIDKVSVRPGLFSSGGLALFTVFVSRVLVSPLPLTVAVVSLGWPTIAGRLSRTRLIGRHMVYINMFLMITVRVSRLMTQYLAAREARIVSRSRPLEWRALASSLGDTLYRLETLSRSVHQAYVARCVERC